MSNFKDILKGLIKRNKCHINPLRSTTDELKGMVAYNFALEELEEFIESYEKGTLPAEYLDGLELKGIGE